MQNTRLRCNESRLVSPSHGSMFALLLAFAAGCGASAETSDGSPEFASVTQADSQVPNPPPLSRVAVPQPIGGNIVNVPAAIRLGKALFWDIQAGGDGQTACATCHAHAGADNRLTNTMNPGPNGTFESGGVTGPGQTWNGTSVAQNADDIIGSQGVVGAVFSAIDANPNNAADSCTPDQTAPFLANRRVTGRNAPTVIGAVFFRDNFWDGRANHRFNGINPFGDTANNVDGNFLDADNASLASQAVGPPNNPVEMSCLGRLFNGSNSLASKLLARTPLGKQVVSTTDSVLGALANATGTGLTTSYTQMVVEAFGAGQGANAQAEFSMFWGQAVQAYEATLIPDQTPFDKFLAGDNNAMTSNQKAGWTAFKGKGGNPTDRSCFSCHAGSELSDATVSYAAAHGTTNVDGGDQGFHNIGVRPTNDDLGRGATGPNGVDWSVSGSNFDRGAFKTPGLRNVKLTGPYFHDGGVATLAEVFEFYHDHGFFENSGSLASQFDRLNTSGGDRNSIVDFLTNALTDCRVEKRRAPFDGPALPLPNGAALAAVGANGTGSCP
ncbi:MAG TPA: cytochrome c peroxidase [Polyangiaceae bacterium]|nr:cytochrome c peroxidase [Polyangiaceae bacterium]